MNRSVIQVAIIAGAHVVLCALGTDAGAADGNGYKGIPWGTACEDAIARLENTGVEFRTFNSSTRREGFANSASSGGPLRYGDWYIPNAWCPGNDTAMTAAFGSGSPYAEAAGSAGDVDFTAYCRTGRFVGVQMSAEASSPEGRRAVALLKKTAGPAITTNPDVGAVHSVLKPRGDSARFLSVTKNVMYGIESATYSVVESMEWKTLRAAYLQCSHQNAESEKRDQRRNRRQAESVVE